MPNAPTYQELIFSLQKFWADRGCVLQQPYDIEVGAGTMAPENVQELYLESLTALGIDLRKHDIKFEEDNWEAPTLAAWGVGWQVMLDGLEITQFTYFQQCGGIDLDPICAELTYGLERIAAFLQDVDSIYDIVWARDPQR